MLAPVNAMRNISALIGAAILLAVSLVSFLAARGITRPIMALTGTMGSLASGDHAIEIPGTERGDELGLMAKAVLVFKENMIKAKELAAREDEAQAEREARALTIDRLTADFDHEATLTLKPVASATTELQTTATAIPTPDEPTSTQATARRERGTAQR